MQSEGSSFSTVADGNRDLLLMWHTCASFLGGPPGPGCRQWKVRSNLFRCWIITQDCRSEWLCSVQSDARLLSTPVRSRRGFSEHVYMHVCVKSVPTWLSVAVQKDGGASWHLCVQFCVNGADKVVWRCFHSNGGKAGLTGTIVNLLWQTSLLLCENLQLKEHRKTDSHQNLFSVHFFFQKYRQIPKPCDHLEWGHICFCELVAPQVAIVISKKLSEMVHKIRSLSHKQTETQTVTTLWLF